MMSEYEVLVDDYHVTVCILNNSYDRHQMERWPNFLANISLYAQQSEVTSSYVKWKILNFHHL